MSGTFAHGEARTTKPSKTKSYVLKRTLPDGTVKTSEPGKLADAERSLMSVLHYNQGVSKSETSQIAPRLRHVSVGETIESHGYRFRLLEA